MVKAKRRKSQDDADKENDTRVNWTDNEKAILVNELKAQKLAGRQAENGWKPQAYVACAEVLSKQVPTREGLEKTAKKCQDHWSFLKKKFLEVQELRKMSGFGWDDSTSRAIATEEVWKELLAKHSKYTYWKKKPFPLYDEINFLVEGVVATGAGAFHAGSQSQVVADVPWTPPPSQIKTRSPTPLSAKILDPALFDDEITTEISTDHKNLSISTPASLSTRKRSRAPSDPISPDTSFDSTSSHRLSKGRRHQRGPDAVSEVADAIRSLSNAVSNSNKQSTPERLNAAIQLMEDDADLSDSEQVKVIRLFSNKSSTASSFLAIRKISLRTAFIQSMIEDEF